MNKYKNLKIELSKNYKKIAVIIAEDYASYGSYYKLERIYGTSKANLCRLIKGHLGYIQEYYPEVYRDYNLKVKENNKKSAESRRKPREYLLCSDNRAFKELPKQIKYEDFLTWCVKFNTGDLTGTDLISMAEKNGIRVIN